jgi:protein phosphatase 2C family protein 2/3
MDKKQQKDNHLKLASSSNIPKLSKNEKRKSFDQEDYIPAKSSKIISKSVLVKGSEDKNTKALNNAFEKTYPNYGVCVHSQKPQGLMKSYAYNSYKGLVKDFNEDRVVVVSQIQKPPKTIHRTWPKMSYFGIFDGHGGETCSEYLKNNFLNILVENKNFPFDIKTALVETFEKLEEEFYNQNKNKPKEEIDNSGSCGLVAILTENKIYIANIGDSRAIMSLNNGSKVKQLSTDHKPNNIKEFERIIKNGGKVYIDDDYKEDENGKIDESQINFITNKSDLEKYSKQKEAIFRHFPSDLAVMRTIGDLAVKKKEYGGLPGNIIATPDIFVYDYSPSQDFMVMGCDGIFDDLSNEEIVEAAWHIFKNKAKEKNYDINLLTADSCDMIMKYAMDLLTSDNLTCIVIGMEGLQKFLSLKKIKEKK